MELRFPYYPSVVDTPLFLEFPAYARFLLFLLNGVVVEVLSQDGGADEEVSCASIITGSFPAVTAPPEDMETVEYNVTQESEDAELPLVVDTPSTSAQAVEQDAQGASGSAGWAVVRSISEPASYSRGTVAQFPQKAPIMLHFPIGACVFVKRIGSCI